VFVVVVFVLGVAMAVVQVVDVVAMLDGLVAAVCAMGVLVEGVLSRLVMFVVVAFVLGVPMAVVQVVDVVAMLDGLVATVRAMGVGTEIVFSKGVGHGISFVSGDPGR